jgi:hypothetical protein
MSTGHKVAAVFFRTPRTLSHPFCCSARAGDDGEEDADAVVQRLILMQSSLTKVLFALPRLQSHPRAVFARRLSFHVRSAGQKTWSITSFLVSTAHSWFHFEASQVTLADQVVRRAKSAAFSPSGGAPSLAVVLHSHSTSRATIFSCALFSFGPQSFRRKFHRCVYLFSVMSSPLLSACGARVATKCHRLCVV